MTLAQLKMITDIFTTMKNKQRIFTGVSSKEKMILQEHQMLQNQEVKLGMTEEDITFLEQFIIQLQDVYTTELFQYELAEETTEDSEDNLDDFMDIDDQ